MNNDTKSSVGPRDFFLHVGATAALYTWAIAFIALAFDIINYFFPDVLEYASWQSNMSVPLGTLIVAGPLYAWLLRVIRKDVTEHSEKESLWVRKWGIGLTLFVSAITFAISLIRLVISFVGGALTLPVILKIAFVLIFAGAIFYFYKRDYSASLSERAYKWFTWGVIIDTVILISVTFALFGGPATQRDLRLDQERVRDLQNIQSQVISYYQNNEALPEHLSELENAIGGFSIPTDPVTNEEYNYQVYPETVSFDICATFALEEQSSNRLPSHFPQYGIKGESFWTHDAGYYCFSRTIDPKLLDSFKR
ncbi:MAG: DUF5671 domain-containing protein [Candidatus Paceibacterota bacterium]